MTPEEEQKMLDFNYLISEYVKTIDKNLWDKAVDFAATMTKYPGIEFGQAGNTG